MSELQVVSGPQNMRIGLRLPELGPELFYLPLSLNLGPTADVGAALAQQLNALLRKLRDELDTTRAEPGAPPPLPDPLQLEIAVESDAPCRFDLSQFALHYHLQRHSLPLGEDKQVLRFQPGSLDQQQLLFGLPPGATLLRAQIAVAGSAAAGEAATSDTAPVTALPRASDQGLRLDPKRGAASPLTLGAPSLVSGWQLMFTALSADTQLQLELQTDREGSPGGERLAHSSAVLGKPGHATLLNFSADEPFLAQPGRYWLTVSCREGAALWHLQTAAGERSISFDSDGTGERSIPDKVATTHWQTSSGDNSAESPPQVTLNGTPLSASRRGKDLHYDLMDALGPRTAAGSEPLAQVIKVYSAEGKPLTFYPPLVEFELAGQE